MRKAISLFLFSLVLFLSLSSCSDGRVKIEDYEWKMRCVMHQEDNRIVYDAAEEMSSVYPGAKAVELTLVASNGKITVTDKTNDKTYVGTYTVSSKNPRGTEYKIVIDGNSGNAGAAMTTYANGDEEPTLPISIGGYSIYFYAK